LEEDSVKKERRTTQDAPARGKPSAALFTDFIFVSIATYIMLNYLRAMFNYVETPLIIIRETLFAVIQLMALILLVVRSGAEAFSAKKADYVYTILGFSSPLLFQPTHDSGPIVVGALLEAIGLVLVVGSFLCLNRSFGLAPENRGVKTGGVYRFVRHPMYLGYILAESGYVFDNFSAFNLLIWILSILFLLLRLHAEERLLQQDRAYRNYARQTRWKLIPLIF
jgi:protein-S-isoprenylcysteine O-methyltransferase Ste14